MIERIKQILVFFFTPGVIFVNYLAGTGYINGITPEVVSNKYPTFITPAGYAFSIWALIYLGTCVFSIFQLLPSTIESLRKTRTFYLIACLANVGWIFSWHNELIPLSLIAMVVLLSSLVMINIDQVEKNSVSNFWFTKVPFSIYFGWVSIATVLNSAILLISFGINTSDFYSTVIACLLIAIVTTVGVIVREKISTFAYPLVLAWALTAIAVKQSGKTAIIFFCAFGVIALLISTLSFFVKDHGKFE